MPDSAQTYTDLRSVEQYRKLLRNLHTLNASESHATLVRMLEGLLASPLGPEEQLEVLESARQTITFVQHEMSSRYAAHPLPPDSQEDATLRQVVRLWTALSTAYARLAEGGSGSDEFRAQWPLLAQRRIQYLGQVIIEYFRAHRAEPPGAWKAVHAAFLEAERAGVTHSRVIDPLNNTWKAQSPDEAYIALLLVDLTNPYGRNQRELNWICRWAQRFAPYCIMQTNWEKDDARAYGLDLTEDHGLRPVALIGSRPGMRRFDGHRLAAQIKAMLAEFKQGTTRPPWAWATTAPSPPAHACWSRCTARGACRRRGGVSRGAARRGATRSAPTGRPSACSSPAGISCRPTAARHGQPLRHQHDHLRCPRRRRHPGLHRSRGRGAEARLRPR
jgi:hypothetical protein